MMRGVRHFLLALQFFTRVPVTGRLADWVGFSPAMLRASAAHYPGVGWLIGAVSAGVLWLSLTRLPPAVAAILATSATVWITGAFHEDGLADTADGLGGTVTKARALEIMKDSRLGTYGTITLVLMLALKVSLLATLATRDVLQAVTGLLCAHVLSRGAQLFVIRALAHVGDDAGSKSKPLADSIELGAIVTGMLWSAPALLLPVCTLGPRCAVAMVAACAAATVYMARMLKRRLGGFTGDGLGATQQVSEVAMYLALALTT